MKTAISFAAAALMVALATLLPAQTTRPAANQVTITNFSFSPQTLTVPAGTTVTWVNKDDVPHTVRSSEKRFSSQALDTDEQFSHKFDAPGTYPYFCSIHPRMTGKIIVK